MTDDGRYLVIDIGRGVPARREDIVFRDLNKPDSPFEVLVWGWIRGLSQVCQGRVVYQDRLQIAQWQDTARLIRGSCRRPGRPLCRKAPNVIEDWSIVGGKIYVNRLKDVKTETTVYTLEGKAAGTMDYEGIGSASGFGGAPPIAMVFRVSSFILPLDDLPAGYGDWQARGVFSAEGSL